jgi:hypothetical protein
MIPMMGMTFPDSWITISNSLPFLSRLEHNQQYKIKNIFTYKLTKHTKSKYSMRPQNKNSNRVDIKLKSTFHISFYK